MRIFRITHVTEAGTRSKIAQRWTACRTARARRWLNIGYMNYPITETRIEFADIPKELWKQWNGEHDAE